MSNTKFGLREVFAANFESALIAAGMQRSIDTDTVKPKFWRGAVGDTNYDMFLLYDITDNLENQAADNKSFRRSLYANGSLYTRSGFSSGNFQDLASSIEIECKNRGIRLTFSDEGKDTSIDQDSPIFYCNFEAEQKLLM